MARKESPPDYGPSKLYLVSFGDTMTTLLAFFIVLCSMAEEQTGANLHAGTGSFIRALKAPGSGGSLSSSHGDRTVELKHASPLYIVEDTEGRQPEKNPTGPDDEDDKLRVIDREMDDFHRFVNEMERLSEVEESRNVEGEVTFDLFNKINREAPHLQRVHMKALAQVIPMLRRPNYRMQIIVWSTTPGTRAWKRAISQSVEIQKEIAKGFVLNESRAERLTAVGRPWPFSDIKRPIVSIVVKKIE